VVDWDSLEWSRIFRTFEGLMPMSHRLIPVIAAALVICTLLTGCTTSSGLRAYRGLQQDWPTAPGAVAEEIEGIPLYRTFPERPYIVLGSLSVTGDQWQVGFVHESQSQMLKRVLKSAVREAKKAGANAAIYDSQSRFLSSISVRDRGANVDVTPLAGSTASLIAIRFKD
jgi:hypothetical protein